MYQSEKVKSCGVNPIFIIVICCAGFYAGGHGVASTLSERILLAIFCGCIVTTRVMSPSLFLNSRLAGIKNYGVILRYFCLDETLIRTL